MPGLIALATPPHPIPSPAVAAPKRAAAPDTVICIRLKQKYALSVESRFELHSVSGYRLQNGALQVERIAGFCHLKNTLKTYWLDQVESVRSPCGEAIGDLAKWLDERQPSTPPIAVEAIAASGNASLRGRLAEPKRQADPVSRSIDKAIQAATVNGFGDIADRLRAIRSILAEDRATPCRLETPHPPFQQGE